MGLLLDRLTLHAQRRFPSHRAQATMSVEFWIILGVALLLIEFALPGLLLLFFGVGALIVALTTAIGLTSAAGAQWLVFSAISIAALLGFRRLFRRWFYGRVEDRDDRASGEVDAALGEVVAVSKGFVEGHGEVLYNGTRFQALWRDPQHTPPVVGGHVRIVDRDGIRLVVGPTS